MFKDENSVCVGGGAKWEGRGKIFFYFIVTSYF